MLRNISYRFKVPLMLTVTILFTGLVVSLALTWRAYGDLREDLFRNALDVGGVLTNTLPAAIRHDDLWLAYRILGAADRSGASVGGRFLTVLDEDYRVYVSNQPRRFPVLSRLRQQGEELAGVEREIRGRGTLSPYVIERPGDTHMYAVIPMVDDGVILGTLIMGYPRALFLPRYYAIVRRVLYSSLVVLAILLPLGWYLGGRAIQPLTHLATCLGKVGQQPPEQVDCSLLEGKDEIGRLGSSFHRMLQELREKQRLERRMLASERLAAIGRLAAGIAHEINNPLGGMINAISTSRRHGHPDPVTEKTLSLVERGLHQIAVTVSALLVEARSESRPLTPHDVDDVFTLIQPDAQKQRVRLDWNNGLSGDLPLPSTQVRQVLLNLSLNAVQASAAGATVVCDIRPDRDRLRIQVGNEGEIAPHGRIEDLFEPFVRHSPSGSGLGLWVSYQIVRRLEGEIDVVSEHGYTRFNIVFPYAEAA